MFGGGDANAQQYGDTWEWDGTTWTQRTDFGPPPTAGAKLIYTGAECMLFGGMHNNSLQNQSWTWNGTYWTARQDMGPSARMAYGLAFDSARQRVVLFGGMTQAAGADEPQTPVGDTWEQNADAGSQNSGGGQSDPIMLSSFQLSDLQSIGGPANGVCGITLSRSPDRLVELTLALLGPGSDHLYFTQGGYLALNSPQSGAANFPVTLEADPGFPFPQTATFAAILRGGNMLQNTVVITSG